MAGRSMPWGAVAIGAVALGGAAFLFWRAAAAASPQSALGKARMDLGLDSSGLPPGVSVTAPQGSQPTSSLLDRLNSGDQARQIFGTQALIWSFGTDETWPDGQLATVNRQLSQLSALSSGAIGASYSSASYAQVRQWLFAQDPGRTLRTLPFMMPQQLVDAVNTAQSRVDPGAIALQVAIMPAG